MDKNLIYPSMTIVLILLLFFAFSAGRDEPTKLVTTELDSAAANSDEDVKVTTPIEEADDAEDESTAQDTGKETKNTEDDEPAVVPDGGVGGAINQWPPILFWGKGCSQCADEKEFLAELEAKYDFETFMYEITEDDRSMEIMKATCKEYSLGCGYIPLLIVGNKSFVKYLGAEGDLQRYVGEGGYVGYGNQIEAEVAMQLGIEIENEESSEEIDQEPKAFDQNHVPEESSISAESDKGTYGEGEMMTIEVKIASPREYRGCYLRAEGMNDWVDETLWVPVPIGISHQKIERKAPICFGCAGFEPGEYDVDFFLKCGSEIIAEDMITIEVRDG